MALQNELLITREIYKESQKQNRQYSALVKKSNVAIRNARYTFSLNQQKILCYLITHLSENDTSDTPKIFDIKTFFDFMEKNTKTYERVRDDLKELRDKSWYVKCNDGSETTVSFLSKVRTNKRDGKATVFFDKDILPLLQHLRSEYTQYKLYYVMTMKSQYSIRLYELLKSVAGKRIWYFEIEQLRKLFMCEKKYSLIADFKKRAIEPAIREINEKTDLSIEYEYQTEGRKVVGIECIINYKSDKERLEVDKNIRAELDK